MKVVSFNINGIRSRLHQLEQLIAKHTPDLIGLQEIKVEDAAFPREAIEALGYHAEYFGQKGHYGVALLSKIPPLTIVKGLPHDGAESQKRVLTGVYPTQAGSLTVINAYFPQGESRDHPAKFPAKRQFYADMRGYLEACCDASQPLILLGDFNVAPGDTDVGIGEESVKRWLKTGKCSFLPEEREWFQTLVSWGLGDSYRLKYPRDGNHFSWFDYRSKGFDREPKRGLRIDLILVSPTLASRLRDAGIDYEIRASDRPSDHCPVWAEFALDG